MAADRQRRCQATILVWVGLVQGNVRIGGNQAAACGAAQAVSRALSRKGLFEWRFWRWAASMIMTTCRSRCPVFLRSTLLNSRSSSRKAVRAAFSPTRGVPNSCNSPPKRRMAESWKVARAKKSSLLSCSWLLQAEATHSARQCGLNPRLSGHRNVG